MCLYCGFGGVWWPHPSSLLDMEVATVSHCCQPASWSHVASHRVSNTTVNRPSIKLLQTPLKGANCFLRGNLKDTVAHKHLTGPAERTQDFRHLTSKAPKDPFLNVGSMLYYPLESTLLILMMSSMTGWRMWLALYNTLYDDIRETRTYFYLIQFLSYFNVEWGERRDLVLEIPFHVKGWGRRIIMNSKIVWNSELVGQPGLESKKLLKINR